MKIKKTVIYGTVLMWVMMIAVMFPQTKTTGNLKTYITGLINNFPNSSDKNEYIEPTLSQLVAFRKTITNILNKKFADAAIEASKYGYKLVEYTDNGVTPNKKYYILERNGSNHWGVFVFNLESKRSGLVIQAPHTFHDKNTELQSFYIFRKVENIALFIAGSHRCNSLFYSPCDGSTTACSDKPEKYRVSDQAHNVLNTFSEGTRAFEEFKPDSYIYIQLHGYSQQSGEPDFIMSNGTTKYPNRKDYLTELKNNLLLSDATFTFKRAHIDYLNFNYLYGTENMQGRIINKSSDPCSQAAVSNEARFLHIEQAYSGIRDTETNWNKMASAIEKSFTIDTPPVALEKEDLQIKFKLNQNYPNPFNPETTISFRLSETAKVTLKIIDILGKEIITLLDEEKQAGEYYVKFSNKDVHLSSGTYYYQIKSGNYQETKKFILLK